jgi:hypothetical protein
MKIFVKRYSGPIIFLVIIAATILFLTSVKFGVVTLDILERVTGTTIEYENIEGNILSGFRIGRYRVRFSETDSLYGELADIHYRLNPFMLRLPNLFEINLIEPTISVEEKTNGGGPGFRGLPSFRLGLRVNLKNGTVIYKSEDLYRVDRISGIVFLDVAGSRAHLTTMNLSFRSQRHSLIVKSMNLSADVDEGEIILNAFKLSGAGLALEGSGHYSFEAKRAQFDFVKAHVDLQQFDWHKGKVDFSGRVTYANESFMPQIRGSATGFYPFDRFGFETNAAVDTIWVNVFDGEILGGTLFAQLRVVQLEDFEFAMNFRELDVSPLIGLEMPVITTGYLAYTDENFVGLVSSPADSGLGLDSLFLYGSFVESNLYLDSLYVLEGKRTLRANGTITPELDLYVSFNDFDVDRFQRYFPVAGRLNGSFHVAGEPRDLFGLRVTSDILASDFSIYDLKVEHLAISSVRFQKDNQERNLSITLKGLEYKDIHLGHTDFRVEDSLFTFAAADSADSILIEGVLREEFQGTISSLIVNYNQVLMKNLQPISFDIIDRLVGDVNLSLAHGSLEFSRVPLSLELTDVDLQKLGRLFGLKEDMSGILDLSIQNDTILISARNIDFLGLENGILGCKGYYTDGSVVVESLSVRDDHNQEFDLRGIASLQESELSARFKNVGVWVLYFLENVLDDPAGLMTGEVTFRGNIEKFELNGGGRIHDARFAVGIIASQFDSVDIDVIFDGDKIVFTQGTGLISPKNGRKLANQWVNAGGIIKLEPRFGVDDLNLEFSFVDAPLQFPPFAYGIGSGNLSLNMRDRVMHYNGNISIKEGVVPLEFGMKIEEEQEEATEDWRMNLVLKAERGVWLRNRDADIEFGGELYVVKEEGPVYLTGIMETDRGKYYWVNHVLSITQGRVTFIPEDEIDPEVDFWAELDTREGVKIILHLFGPISEPVFEFFTDPPGQYTEQDIVTYLNLNITWQELEEMKRGEYMTGFSHSVLSWLEGDVSRRIRQYTGLDYFRIETPFFEADEKTKLTVGKFISRNLFVTYTYDITTFSNEFNVEYMVDDKNRISVERDETGEYRLQYNYNIRF